MENKVQQAEPSGQMRAIRYLLVLLGPLALATSILLAAQSNAAMHVSAANSIAAENQLEGSTGWKSPELANRPHPIPTATGGDTTPPSVALTAPADGS
jgi:hypothetical protein